MENILAEQSEPVTILLVENEKLSAIIQTRVLENFGYRVRVAPTGEEAVGIALSDPSLDLILMDIELGEGMGGPEAAQRISQERQIPIVFLSSHTEPEYMEMVKQVTRYGYVLKNSGNFILRSAIEMALELFKSHKETQDWKERLLRAEDIAGFGSWEFNLTTNRVIASEGAKRIYGLEGQGWSIPLAQSVPLPQYRPLLDRALRDLIQQGTPYDLHFEIKRHNDQDIRIIHSIAKYDRKKNIVTGIIHDITEQKRMENALRSSEESLSITLQSIGDGVIATDIDGRVTRMNPTAQQLTGWNFADAQGRPLEEVFDIINAFSREAVPNPVKKVLELGKIVGLANHTVLRSRNGEEYHIADSASPIRDSQGVVRGVVLVFSDVSERYKAERAIQSLLEEKDLILREVHHRVKNNMNTMKSLLFLQSQTVDDPHVSMALQDAGNRLQSMYVLYEKLYRSSSFNEVSLVDYIPALIDEVLDIFPNSPMVGVETHIAPISVDTKIVSTLGIIINELITNSMKYAFRDRTEGTLAVTVENQGDSLQMVVQDDGPGLPESVGFENSNGFGLMLVGNLAKQLRGELAIERTGGTKIILQFPWKK
jgi:PAS domain S-box-containing protein